MPPLSRRANKNDLAWYHASFLADDTLVEFVPNFTCPTAIPLPSSFPVGPLTAGQPTMLPLWMAVRWDTQSLGRIVAPSEWWGVAPLRTILAYEQTHTGLFPTTSDHAATSKAESKLNDTANDDYDVATATTPEIRLPSNYYALGLRLCRQRTAASDPDAAAIGVLLEDLLHCRVDKLRQQFQSLLLDEHKVNDSVTHLVIQVPGIGSPELALLQDFVQQALQDRAWLMQETTDAAAVKGASSSSRVPKDLPASSQSTAGSVRKPVRSRLPVRRFRK